MRHSAGADNADFKQDLELTPGKGNTAAVHNRGIRYEIAVYEEKGLASPEKSEPGSCTPEPTKRDEIWQRADKTQIIFEIK